MASAYVLQLINNLKTAVDQQADYQVYSPTQLGEVVRRITSIIDVYWEIKLMNYFDAMFTRVRVGGKTLQNGNIQCKFYFKFKSETTGIDGFCYET